MKVYCFTKLSTNLVEFLARSEGGYSLTPIKFNELIWTHSDSGPNAIINFLKNALEGRSTDGLSSALRRYDINSVHTIQRNEDNSIDVELVWPQ